MDAFCQLQLGASGIGYGNLEAIEESRSKEARRSRSFLKRIVFCKIKWATKDMFHDTTKTPDSWSLVDYILRRNRSS